MHKKLQKLQAILRPLEYFPTFSRVLAWQHTLIIRESRIGRKQGSLLNRLISCLLLSEVSLFRGYLRPVSDAETFNILFRDETASDASLDDSRDDHNSVLPHESDSSSESEEIGKLLCK